MSNVPMKDLGCLTCLLQSMANIVQEEVANESKLVSVVTSMYRQLLRLLNEAFW